MKGPLKPGTLVTTDERQVFLDEITFVSRGRLQKDSMVLLLRRSPRAKGQWWAPTALGVGVIYLFEPFDENDNENQP